jgi:hypothetical protein
MFAIIEKGMGMPVTHEYYSFLTGQWEPCKRKGVYKFVRRIERSAPGTAGPGPQATGAGGLAIALDDVENIIKDGLSGAVSADRSIEDLCSGVIKVIRKQAQRQMGG